MNDNKPLVISGLTQQQAARTVQVLADNYKERGFTTIVESDYCHDCGEIRDSVNKDTYCAECDWHYCDDCITFHDCQKAQL